MNRIAIKSKNIQQLEELLKKTIDADFSVKDDSEIIIIFKDKNIKDKLSLALAAFIANSVEQEFIEIIKNEIPKDKYNKDVFSAIQDDYKKFLYIEPIKILLFEHFKINHKIDIESFILFNCRGLQKEFYSVSKDYLQLYLEELKNEKLETSNANKTLTDKDSNTLSIDSAITYYSYIKELNDLIRKLKEESNSKNFDYNRFREVHVKSNGKQIVLTDNENKIIENELEGILPINVINSLQGGNDILKAAITIISYISILKTSCVVIHKSIPDETINRILLYLYDSREVNPELLNVNLLQCNSCSVCNLTT